MADLLALQPNMNIKLHIVAPAAKREKVFQEIRRPVFLLEKGPSRTVAHISPTTVCVNSLHENILLIFRTQCLTNTRRG